MIPEKLQDSLVEELKKLFGDTLYDSLDDKPIKLNIFAQELPEKKYDEDEDVKFPFIVVELSEGDIPSEADAHTCKVNFIIGTVSKPTNNKPYSAVYSIINKIYYLLSTKKIFNNQFELQYPISWDVVSDDSNPYYYGGLETNWIIPKLVANDNTEESWD